MQAKVIVFDIATCSKCPHNKDGQCHILRPWNCINVADCDFTKVERIIVEIKR